jgi:uncharacterized cupredoxin-like copper-binding protein
MSSRLFSKHPMTGAGVVSASLTVLVALAASLASGGATAHASGKTRAEARATIIKVTMGKPSELRFALSKFSNIPVGSITFQVTDAGLAFHDFKLCKMPISKTASSRSVASLKNACAGTSTRILKPGQKQTIAMTIRTSGVYEFLCAVTGHAAAGMKGILGVGVKVTALAPISAKTTTTTPSTPPPPSTTTTTTPPTTTTTGGGGTSSCPPGQTIVGNAKITGGDVDEDDNGGPDDGDGCV